MTTVQICACAAADYPHWHSAAQKKDFTLKLVIPVESKNAAVEAAIQANWRERRNQLIALGKGEVCLTGAEPGFGRE